MLHNWLTSIYYSKRADFKRYNTKHIQINGSFNQDEAVFARTRTRPKMAGK